MHQGVIPEEQIFFELELNAAGESEPDRAVFLTKS